MADRLDRLLTAALVACAIVTTAAFVHGQLSAAKTVRAKPAPPTYLSVWPDAARAGIVIGNSSAPIKILEFADFECPYCRRADSVFRGIERQFGDTVALVFVHDPLAVHRFAMPAARAAECADVQGRFQQYHDVIYDKQDSLGLKSWTWYAQAAGVRDTVAFNACLKDNATMPRIDSGRAWARRLKIHATPTVIVDGWLLSSPPDSAELADLIRSLLSRRNLLSPKGL